MYLVTCFIRQIAAKFRKDNLDSFDNKDQTKVAEDWTKHSCKGKKALGGPYIAAHVRRKDFLLALARKEFIPSLEKLAKDLKTKMKEHGVKKVCN